LSYEMANKVFEFHARFNSLLLTDQEVALLMPILITSPCKSFFFFLFYVDNREKKGVPHSFLIKIYFDACINKLKIDSSTK
jgi:hypothetical protein